MLVPLPATELDTEVVLGALADKARAYANDARSANTLRAYESDLRAFCAWCQARGLSCLPATAETVSLYIADVAETMKDVYKRQVVTVVLAAVAAFPIDKGKGL